MTLVAGADVAVQADLGQATFILNRDHLNVDTLTPPEDAWDEITCEITRASWSSGASQPLGPLTTVAGGRIKLELLDLDRTFDPSNTSSSVFLLLHVGTPLRILADGAPLWTGTLETWDHDLGPAISTLAGVDAYAGLAALTLPTGTPIAAGYAVAQIGKMLDAVGWPATRRVFSGTPGAYRSAVTVDGKATQPIEAARLAELGDLWADHDGNIAVRGRGTVYEPDPAAIVNCGGAILASLDSLFDRTRVRNVVEIDGHVPFSYSDAGSVQRHGPHVFGSSTSDLALTDPPAGVLKTYELEAIAEPRVPPASLAATLSSAFMSPNIGGGADQHLPVGYWGGNNFRSAIRWPAIDWSGVAAVTSAKLRLRTTGQVHVGFGSGPRIYCRRLTESWSPNSATNDGGGNWSSAQEAYPGPGSTTAGQASSTVTRAEETTFDVDVTAIVRAWAPVAAGGGGTGQYGIGLFPYAEGSGTYTTEVYSAKVSGKQPLLLLTVVTNHPPNAPVPVAPVGPGATVAGGFVADVTDADGDAIAQWNVELQDGNAATIWTKTAATGITGGHIVAAYDGAALVAGGRYAWRMRAQDAPGGWGAFTSWIGFTSGTTPPDVFGRWAATILGELALPKPLTILGTIRPQGDEVAAICGAEYGDRLEVVDVHVSPAIDRIVRIVGMSVDLAPDPDGFAVTVVSEDES